MHLYPITIRCESHVQKNVLTFCFEFFVHHSYHLRVNVNIITVNGTMGSDFCYVLCHGICREREREREHANRKENVKIKMKNVSFMYKFLKRGKFIYNLNAIPSSSHPMDGPNIPLTLRCSHIQPIQLDTMFF